MIAGEPGRRMRRWTWGVAVASVILAVAYFGPWHRAYEASLLGDVIYIGVSVVAAVMALQRARETTGGPRIVYLFGARAMVFSVAARVIILYFPQLLQPERSGPFTAGAITVVYGLGIVALWWATADRRSITYILDGLLISTSLLFLPWHTMLAKVLQNFAGNGSAALLAVGSPVFDLVMFTMAMLAARRGTNILSRKALLIFAGAEVLDGIGDTWWAFNAMRLPQDNVMGYVWTLYCLVLTLAFLADGPADRSATPKSASLTFVLMPYVPPVLAGGAAVWMLLTKATVTTATWSLAGVVVGVLLVRQFLAMFDNVRISKELAGTVDQLRARELELEHLALHDALTALPNRRYLNTRVVDAHDTDSEFVVLLIDLDDFKNVNDTLGHEAGDTLLQHVADCLRSSVRSGDTVARLGGDEFAVLLEHTDVGLATAIATRITKALSDDVLIGGVRVQVGLSIGLALGRGLENFDNVMRQADIAMYERKRAEQKGGLAVFSF